MIHASISCRSKNGCSHRKKLDTPLSVVDDAVNLNFGAPEAMTNLSVRYKRRQIQPAPAVKTNAAKQTQNGVGLVFSVRPKLGNAGSELRIGRFIFLVSHAAIFSAVQEADKASEMERTWSTGQRAKGLGADGFCTGNEGVILHSISCRNKNGASHRKNFDTPPLRGSCECTEVHFQRFQRHDNFRCT
jgi:hypothetical protein